MRRYLFGLGAALALLLGACMQSPPPPSSADTCTPTATGQGFKTQGLEASWTLPQGLGDFSAPHVPGELLVAGEGLSPQALSVRVQGVEPLRRLRGGSLLVRVPPGEERAKAEALLRAGARWVQPNYLYFPLRIPSDPLYRLQQKSQLNGLVGLEGAWDYSTGDANLIVAVVDTGYLLHQDLSSRWYLPPGVNLDVADGDPDPTDDTPSARDTQNPFSHGLAVASVLGAETDNRQFMAGVTWHGRLLPLKVARLADGSITTADIKDAVDLAVQQGAKVINISLGRLRQDSELEQSLRQARSQGVVLVAAAGNDGVDGVLYPASSPAVIAVGSVNNSKAKSKFSNCGPELDLVAPGEGVTVLFPNDDDGQASGTSFASPMVAGVVALYMSKYASERKAWPSPDQVYQCLTATAEDLGPPGHDTGYGFGLVRADRVMTDTTSCFP
ncbi:serine protease [Thermus composti]|uniref:S8 family serine peptidase n=1 Tax=Thermus composti TaxID=532059 RepID=A0ABV6Q3C2_9DEIN|nr:S8 family serine peptidase [Thermus composti]GGM94462.1 serine protease [Thermus composti]